VLIAGLFETLWHRHRLLAVLCISVLIHAALLSLNPLRSSPARPGHEEPAVLTIKLRPLPAAVMDPTKTTARTAPSQTTPSPAPSAPAHLSVTGKVRDQPAESAIDVAPAQAQATPTQDEPQLDLSPTALARATHDNRPANAAQMARAQLGPHQVSPSAMLSRQMASAAVPDCLHEPRDAEKAVVNGLLALPWLAYAAATGKCK
jgi:hypothetical protein